MYDIIKGITRAIDSEALPDDEIYGHLASAGLPKGFKSAAVA